MGLKIEYVDGQTPLDEDEIEGLKIPTITTRGELDEFEQLNIDEAQEWILRNKFTSEKILSEEFIKNLHKMMFGNVWSWAGEFRSTNKNIGSDKFSIGVDLRNLIDDCKFWIENNSFELDEIAIRLSHRIVKIHCFSNGNGRHSRLLADILNEKVYEGEPFTWGGTNLTEVGEIRSKYIEALREADENNYDALFDFVKG